MEYVLPEQEPGVSYEDYREAFEWRLSDRYNIATASLDRRSERQTATALYHVDESGMHHEFTYEALNRASGRLAAALAEDGVGRGTRVAICFPQSPELLVAHLAIYKLGAVCVPLSVLLGDEALSHSLTHSGTELLIADEEVLGTDPKWAEDVPTVYTVALSPSRYDDRRDYLGGLTDVATSGGEVTTAETAPDSPALLLYTSGTSGRPKGVLVGHSYLPGSLPGYHLWFHLFDRETAETQRVWTPSEWAWAGALFDVVFPTLALGGTVVSGVRRSGFDAAATRSFVDETEVTRAFMPPTALALLRSADPDPETSLPTLEVVQSGGEPLSATVQDWAESTFDLVVNEGYGQTEANALVGNCRALFDRRPGSMGRPYPGHDVVVVDEDGERLPTGELGEIAVRGPDPVFFVEYWGDPDATAEKLTDGLFRTGDLAVRDEDGYIWFRGRADDLIVTSGYRVSPVEVEDALERHELVSDAVVGGRPDPDRGTRVAAYVLPTVPSGDVTEADERELREVVAEELGAHKRPREITFVEKFPRTRSGKADRSALFGESDADRDE
jgi:acetyl-CoA synthetase